MKIIEYLIDVQGFSLDSKAIALKHKRRFAFFGALFFVCLLCPLHYLLHSKTDLLTMSSFNGLQRLVPEHQRLLVWAHVAGVWYLVLLGCSLIHRAQRSFLERRFQWLKEIPAPRATTILVENLPKEYRSDEALRFYFLRLFGVDAIHQVGFKTLKAISNLLKPFKSGFKKLITLLNTFKNMVKGLINCFTLNSFPACKGLFIQLRPMWCDAARGCAAW